MLDNTPKKIFSRSLDAGQFFESFTRWSVLGIQKQALISRHLSTNAFPASLLRVVLPRLFP